MSDTSQGPGWWQASDGKWYPPEQVPGGSGSTSPSTGDSHLDIGEALAYGWNKFVQYIGKIIVIVLVIFVVEAVFSGLAGIAYGGESIGRMLIAFPVFLVGWVIALMLQAGLIRVGLAITRGDEPEVGMLFQTANLGSFIIATILVGLLFFVGFLACCIGAVVVGVFTLFYGYYIIDRSSQPVDSITSSFKLVRDNFGTVLLFAIVVVLLNLITCGLAVGVTQISTAYAYKKLTGQPIV